MAWFIQDAGPPAIARWLAHLGWCAPLVLVPYALVMVWDTLGWHSVIVGRRAVPATMLMRLRLAGETLNTIVPSAYLAGEPLKVLLLTRRGVPAAAATTSCVVSKSTMLVSQALFIACATTVGAFVLPERGGLHEALMGAAVFAIVSLALLVWLQRRGVFRSLFDALRMLRIRPRALEARRRLLERIDDRIRRFAVRRRGRFLASSLFHLLGWATGVLEVLVITHLLGARISWEQALVIEALVQVVRAGGLLVPAALGVQESGIAILFGAFGLPAALGMAYAIVRRAREVFFVSLGGLLLLRETYRDRLDIRDSEVLASAQNR